MKELIYKNGQAGVQKANVTIVFDNTDKSRSPDEYKKYDTITIRREIKNDGSTNYTFNATKATNERVR
jgi:structural maintenance of chromosome 2